jgi:hypothetical protein
MYFEVYVSTAARLFEKTELLQLLEQSREKNARLAVTGMLLYKDGNFMQAVEGNDDAVRGLLTTIRRDPRHHGYMTLLRGEIGRRQFPDWSMGFQDLGSPEVHANPGYTEFLNAPLTFAEFGADPSKARRLLKTFKQSM